MLDIFDFKKIINEYDDKMESNGCLKGLNLMYKYTGKYIHGADHDIIYGVDVVELIENNISKEDIILLASYGWTVSEDDYMQRYV